MDSLEAAEVHSAKPEDFFFKWRCGRDGGAISLSDNFEALTGLDPASTSRRPLLGCSENTERTLAIWGEHAVRGEAFHNFTLTISDGTRHCQVLLSGKSFPGAMGRLGGFSGFGTCVRASDAFLGQPQELADERLFERIKEIGKVGYILQDGETGLFRLVGSLRRSISPDHDAVPAEDIRAALLASDTERFDAVWHRDRGEGVTEEVELRFGRDLYDCRHILFELQPQDVGEIAPVRLFAVYRDMTDLRGAETTLKQVEKIAGIGHWTFERAERRIHFSEQAQEIFGTGGADRFTFAELRKRIHPDDREILQVIQRKARARDTGFERQVRIFREDGIITHLLVAGEFDYSETGRLERTFGTIADVSSRVAAEESRRDTEALMGDVFENADCGIVVRDLEDCFIRVNTRAAIQLGLRVDDMLGHTVEEVIARCDRMEDAKLLSGAASSVIASQGAVSYDYSHRASDAAPATEFRVVNFPVTGSDGTVRAVASMRYDITDFVNAQYALKKLNEGLESTVRARTLELWQSEERFRNIASASADWLWELDADLNFIWCSESFFEATGRKQEDYIGKCMTELVTDQERFVDQRDAWSRFLGKLEAKEQVRGIEIERHHPTGNRIVRINAMPVWSDDVFIGFHGSTADISELKQTQAQLIETDRLASLGGLVAGISHEINTPVGVSFTVVTKLMATLADLKNAFSKGKISQASFSRFLSEMDEGLDIIHRGLERTAELITHFKQVAVDQTSLKRREFELSEIVNDIVTTMTATIGRRAVKIETQVTEGIRLDSYPGPLGQVLINLIQNAIFHGFDEDSVEKDEADRIVVAGSFGTSGTVTFSVTDNGKGMSQAVVRRVFEPFFTTKFGSGGSGLGMHLVYSIVHGALGGTVSVSSSLGKGTTVTVMLPVIAPEKTGRELEAGS